MLSEKLPVFIFGILKLSLPFCRTGSYDASRDQNTRPIQVMDVPSLFYEKIFDMQFLKNFASLIDHEKLCYENSVDVKVINYRYHMCSVPKIIRIRILLFYFSASKGMTRPSIHSTVNFVYIHVDIYFLAGWQARAVE